MNAGFLRRLARLGGGTCELVESEERLVEVMGRIHRHLCTPVLTDLRLGSSDLALDNASITPFHLPDLFVGTPLVVMGRYRGQPSGSVTVHARGADGRPWQTSVQGCPTSNPAHSRLWARSRLRDLEDQYDAGHADRMTLEQQIIQTSLRFGVLCRFTAFVAVDRSEQVNPGGLVRPFVQPVELPAGWVDPWAAYGPALPADFEEEDFDAVDLPDAPPDFAPPDMQPPPDWVPLPGVVFESPRCVAGEPRRAQAGVDWADCFRRLADFLQRLDDEEDKSPQERLAVLRSLLLLLQQLLAEMRADGLPPEQYEPLQQLEAALTALLAHPAPDEQVLHQHWEEARQALQQFVGPAGRSTASRRRRFWK